MLVDDFVDDELAEPGIDTPFLWQLPDGRKVPHHRLWYSYLVAPAVRQHIVIAEHEIRFGECLGNLFDLFKSLFVFGNRIFLMWFL